MKTLHLLGIKNVFTLGSHYREGYFEPREVQLGFRAADLVEIIHGLNPGEKIAAAANFLIDSEAKLKGITPLHQPQEW